MARGQVQIVIASSRARLRAGVGLLAALLLLGWIGPAVSAQVGAEVAQVEWTEALLLQRLEAVRAIPGLSDDERLAREALWQQALEALRRADEWATKRDAFINEREAAPVRTAGLRASLEQRGPRQPPHLPSPDDLAGLEQGLAAAQARLDALRREADELSAERSGRTDRRLAIPDLMATARQEQEALDSAEPIQDDDPLAEPARGLRELRRREQVLRAESLAAELSSYEARGELIGLRQDELAAKLDDARADVDDWTHAVTAARTLEAERTSQRARESLDGLADDLPRVAALAEEVAELSQRTLDVQALRLAAQDQLDQVVERLELVSTLHANSELKVEVAGLNDAMAVLLREQRSRVRSLRTPVFELGLPAQLSSDLTLDSFDWSADREDLSRIDRMVEQLLDEVDAERLRNGVQPLPSAQRQDARAVVRDLLVEKRRLIDPLILDAQRTSTTLDQLEAEGAALDDEVAEFERFIDEHILWVRSLPPFDLSEARRAGTSLRQLLEPSRWWATAGELGRGVGDELASLMAAVLVVLGLLVARPITARHIRRIGETVASRRLVPVGPTLTVLALTLTRAALWPALIALTGWRLSMVPGQDLAAALGSGLLRLSLVVIPVELLVHLTSSGGLLEVHLGWGAAAQRSLRRGVRLVQLLVLPTLAVALVCDAPELAQQHEPVGRLGLLVSLVGLWLFTRDQFRADGPVMRGALGGQGGTVWWMRLRWLWYPALLLTPVVLLVAVLLGYQYGSVQVVEGLLQSGTLLLSIIVARGVARRWLGLARARLAFQQHQRRREQRAADAEAAAAAAAASGADMSGEIQAVVEEALELDVHEIDEQAQRLLDVTAGLTLLLGLAVIWADLLPALERLRRIEFWPRGAEGAGDLLVYVTLADVLLAVLVVGFSVLATRNIPGLLEMTVLRRLDLEPGGGYAITTLCRYVLALAGVVFTAQLLGITWDSVQWMAAAITVGLGFGLQEIFANFVAGLIILFERPIRVGDIITVGGIEGVVTKIRTRATTIRDRDRRELLVPNKEFITNQLVNWTLSDPISRLILNVGVAYGTDGDLVERTLVAVAKRHSLVLDAPAPHAVFRSFGDSTLDYELRVFIADRDYWPQVTHELNTAIHAEFGRRGIEIAFPQRDLHLRDGVGKSFKAWLEQDDRPGEPGPDGD